MKNRQIIVAAAVVCAAALVIGGVYAARHGASAADADSGSTSDSSGETPDALNGTEQLLEDDGVAAGDNADTGLPDGTEWRNQSFSSDAGGTTAAAQSEGTTDGAVSFPYSIPTTSLTVVNLAGYDGVFLEDGSDSDVSGVAALVLRNDGQTAVEYADISVNCGGQTLKFTVSGMAAGATVVAQEANRAAYSGEACMGCSATTAEVDALEQSSDKVQVSENEDGSLTVSNQTDKTIPCVRVFYKYYLSESNAYAGGITYTAKLTGLNAGNSQTVTPTHYSAGYSKVVMVRTYDSEE